MSLDIPYTSFEEIVFSAEVSLFLCLVLYIFFSFTNDFTEQLYWNN